MKKKEKIELDLNTLTPDALRFLHNKLPEGPQKHAYGQQLTALARDTAMEQWYLPREIRQGEVILGYIGFKGRPTGQCEVEVAYYPMVETSDNRLFLDALTLLKDWAFTQADCYYLHVQIQPGDEEMHKALTDRGYVCIGAGRVGPLYELERPKRNHLAIYMSLGVAVGAALGVAMDNLAMYMPLGMLLGMALGSSLDKKDKEKRKKPAANPFEDFMGDDK